MIAAFSSASSACMRLSFEFSSWSSFIRRSSETVVPAYSDRQEQYVARLIPWRRSSSTTGTAGLGFLQGPDKLLLAEP